MSTKLAILAFASAALAHPFRHSHHRPSGHPTGTALSWGYGNGTGPYAGTGAPHYPNVTTTELTSTTTSTKVQTVVVTVYPVPVSGSVEAAAVEPTADAVCSGGRQTLTQTVTDRVTVTVQPAASSSSSSLSSSSSSSVIAVSSAPAASSSVAEEATYSTLALVTNIQAAEVAYTAASSSVETAAPYTAAQTSAAAAAATSSSSSSSSSGKRGLAFNDASLTECFTDKSKVSWAYNWGQTESGLSDSFEYVPMLWGLRTVDTADWSKNAQSAIDAGAKHLLGFNEPDLAAQSNLDAAAAAAGHLEYMEPFAGKVKLGSPAVTNGANGMGLDWLSSFVTACSSCTIDFVAVHWYDSASNLEYFKTHLTQAHTDTGKPVWLTEFGATGSDSEISSFLTEAMAWMDSQDFIERYAYFMVADGNLVSGTSESALGSVYATS